MKDIICLVDSIAILLAIATGNHGKAGLELQYNNQLLNSSENAAINELKNLVSPTTEGK